MSYAARALRWLAAKLPPPRVIFDRAGRSPYLSRYYLVGAPKMADGSNPFDATGAPRQAPCEVVPFITNTGVKEP
jgi:hypothetical protein